jgi:hypothetical protein
MARRLVTVWYSLHPERITGLIVQNGNAYKEGLHEFWDPIKKYWADPSAENRKALYFLVETKPTANFNCVGQERFHFSCRRSGTVQPRSQKNETHLLDTCHFALETHGEEIAGHIESFFQKQKRKAA